MRVLSSMALPAGGIKFIGRREFITLLSGAAVARPVVAVAQQPAMPVIGFLGTQSPDMISDRLRRFRQSLKETGYVEGENVTIVYDWAESFDRLSALAAEPGNVELRRWFQCWEFHARPNDKCPQPVPAWRRRRGALPLGSLGNALAEQPARLGIAGLCLILGAGAYDAPRWNRFHPKKRKRRP